MLRNVSKTLDFVSFAKIYEIERKQKTFETIYKIALSKEGYLCNYKTTKSNKNRWKT